MTIKELLQYDYFKCIRLISGESGMERTVSSCGILDYELDTTLKHEYLYTNFQRDQLVLTSFLAAKDNPFLIYNAIKAMAGTRACGLVIKNVYNLPIDDSIRRISDAKKFPIFILNDLDIQIEDFIIQVYITVNSHNNIPAIESQIDRLRYSTLRPEEKKALVCEIFPSIRGKYFISFFKAPHLLSDEEKTRLMNISLPLGSPFRRQKLLFYKNGFFLFWSSEYDKREDDSQPPLPMSFYHLLEQYAGWCIGVSDPHYLAEEMDQAIHEAICASSIQHMKADDQSAPAFTQFGDIGIYRAIFPLIHTNSLYNYAMKILKPILEEDVSYQYKLMETLEGLVKCNGNFHLLSGILHQHENTLRYRMNKIEAITGLNYRNPSDYEELSLAVRVRLATLYEMT